MLIMREAYQAVRDFLAAPAWDGYVIGPYGSANATSDDDIDAYIRNLTSQSASRQSKTLHTMLTPENPLVFTAVVWHPTSTAAMGAEDSDSVTLPDLYVRGTTGLRVVDASVLVCIMFCASALQ